MDEQRIQDRVSETTEKVGTLASDAAKQAGAAMQGKLDQGKAMIQDAQTSAATLARQASDAGRQAMAQAGELVQGAAREAGKIYRHIANARGEGAFITEVSMDETDSPQTPPELLIILAAMADEKTTSATPSTCDAAWPSK